MRITIDIPEKLLEEAQRILGTETVQETIILALEMTISRYKRQEFLDLLGTFDYDLTQEDLRKLRGDDEQQSGTPEDEHGGETHADDS